MKDLKIKHTHTHYMKKNVFEIEEELTTIFFHKDTQLNTFI